MKLVDNWRSLWKSFSVIGGSISGALIGTWILLPPRFQDAFPPEVVMVMAFASTAFGVIGRFIPQPEVSGDKKE